MSDSQRTSNPQLWPIEREELIRWHRQCSQGCTMQDDFNGAAMHNRRATQLEAGAAHEPTSALEPDAVVVNDNQPHWTGIFETQPNVTLPVGTRLVRIEKAQAWEIIAKNRGKLIAGQCSAEPPTCKPLLHIFSAQGDPCLCGAVPWGKPSNTPVYDIDVEKGLMRLDVMGKLDITHIVEVAKFTDADGVEHTPDSFYNEDEATAVGEGNAL
jgi:hypothetical protein